MSQSYWRAIIEYGNLFEVLLYQLFIAMTNKTKLCNTNVTDVAKLDFHSFCRSCLIKGKGGL